MSSAHKFSAHPCIVPQFDVRHWLIDSILFNEGISYLYSMEPTNSLYFEHNGAKYTATVKEDITTDPKILLISPKQKTELGNDIKFELISAEWVGPQWIKDQFPDTYNSLLKAISVAGYL